MGNQEQQYSADQIMQMFELTIRGIVNSIALGLNSGGSRPPGTPTIGVSGDMVGETAEHLVLKITSSPAFISRRAARQVGLEVATFFGKHCSEAALPSALIESVESQVTPSSDHTSVEVCLPAHYFTIDSVLRDSTNEGELKLLSREPFITDISAAHNEVRRVTDEDRNAHQQLDKFIPGDTGYAGAKAQCATNPAPAIAFARLFNSAYTEAGKTYSDHNHPGRNNSDLVAMQCCSRAQQIVMRDALHTSRAEGINPDEFTAQLNGPLKAAMEKAAKQEAKRSI